MLTTSKNPKYAYLRMVAVLPLFAISLILISFQLSAQGKKAKSEAAKEQNLADLKSQEKKIQLKIAALEKEVGKPEDKAVVLDQELAAAALDQKRASLDQQLAALDEKRAMLDQGIITPPTPPIPPAPPSHIKSINVDSSAIVMKGMHNGDVITVTVKGSNKNISPKDQGNIVLKPASGEKMKPLIVIDGVITSDLDMNKINPNNIASMNVLKGEKATTKYAEKGANGVIEITTKKP
jgi:cell division protein FtsB